MQQNTFEKNCYSKGMLIEQIFELRGPGSLAVYVLLLLVVFMTKQ